MGHADSLRSQEQAHDILKVPIVDPTGTQGSKDF